MSAPTKQGLDYFPFDVDLLDNDDLEFLRERYGVVVNDVYISLLTLLYRKKGYYIPYETEAEKNDCIWYVYKRVRGGKHPVQQEAIPIVIEAIVAQRLFDRDHFNKIITSERAQRTYYSATVERKLESFDIIPEYWLLNDETMRKLSKKHPYYLKMHSGSKSDDLSGNSVDYQSKSDDLSQSKVNKSKVNNNLSLNARECKRMPFKTEEYQAFINQYEIIDMPMVGGTLCDMDFKKIAENYSKSTWLKTSKRARYLKFVATHYHEIITGYYEDYNDGQVFGTENKSRKGASKNMTTASDDVISGETVIR